LSVKPAPTIKAFCGMETALPCPKLPCCRWLVYNAGSVGTSWEKLRSGMFVGGEGLSLLGAIGQNW